MAIGGEEIFEAAFNRQEKKSVKDGRSSSELQVDWSVQSNS